MKNYKSYFTGRWWVQDFSSSFALNHLPSNFLDKNNIDLCSAPGGKAFQILSRSKEIKLNDKSKSRLKILKENLNRLNLKAEIINKDVMNFNSSIKYNFIVLDAPCTAIGTIRKNPEILFKKDNPNVQMITKLQKDMLNKASNILEKDGLILYMVCSFLKIETTDSFINFSFL